MLLVHLPSGLIIWYWIINCVPFPREVSPTLGIPYLLSCVGLRLPGFFSLSIGIPIDAVLVQLVFRQSCQWDYECSSAMPYIGDATPQQIPYPYDFKNLSPYSSSISLSIGCKSCIVDVEDGTGLPNFAFWLVVVFFNGIHHLQSSLFDEV